MTNIECYVEKGTVYIRASDVETLLKIAKKRFIKAQSIVVHKMCEEGTIDVRSGRKKIKVTSEMIDEFIGPIAKWIDENVKDGFSKNE